MTTNARSCHLIDIENVLAGRVTACRVQSYWDQHCAALGVTEDDHVVVGSGPAAAPAVWFTLPRWVRRVLGRGVHGGETAIIEGVDVSYLNRRFARVVIASGDGMFADLAV